MGLAWTKQNNLMLNPDKTTCTLFTPDPAEYTSNLELKIDNNALPMATHPNVLGLTLDPKLAYIHNFSVRVHKSLQIIKALTATGWGKQKGTLHGYLQGCYETGSGACLFHMFASCVLDLQVIHNAALRTATGCTQDTNIQHLHDETLRFPIHEYSSTPHNTNRKHNIHRIHYTNTQQTSTLQGYKSTILTTDDTHQTSHIVTTTGIKINMRHTYIYCFYASSHKRQ